MPAPMTIGCVRSRGSSVAGARVRHAARTATAAKNRDRLIFDGELSLMIPAAQSARAVHGVSPAAPAAVVVPKVGHCCLRRRISSLGRIDNSRCAVADTLVIGGGAGKRWAEAWGNE